MNSIDITISKLAARKLALNQQGLLSAKPKFGRGKRAILKAIEHLSYVQIDAISVIQRAHHHTLWSRIPGYQSKHLLDLLAKDRHIFEYWSHAASFLPIKAYRYALPVMQTIRERGKHWYQVDADLKQWILQHIVEEGPKYARDFETPKATPGIMWNWKPAKKALHELFMEGELMVVSRAGFQRLYDVPDRFIPETIDTSTPSREQYLWHCIESTLTAHGLATIPEMRYQRFYTGKELESVLQEKISQHAVIPLQVEGLKSQYFTLPNLVQNIPVRQSKPIHLLSPFDNVVIQRKRVKELFDFNYQTEIYYPVHKRVYGYFSMPILYGTEFIGRMDPKAHREARLLEIRNLALEPSVKVTDSLIRKLRDKLMDFAHFNECDHFIVKKSNPASLLPFLEKS